MKFREKYGKIWVLMNGMNGGMLMLNGLNFNSYNSYGTFGIYGSTERNGIQAVGDDKKGTAGAEDCETCKKRKYQDGSNENVSYKAATHISPEAAGSAVRAHESEHVSNAYKKAAEKGGKVVNASVNIHTSVCPECGKTYVSGGVTNTTIKYTNEENPYVRDKKMQDATIFLGQNVDLSV